MKPSLEVECSHIERELMRVRFAHSQLVSDHPAQWGGTDTGPAPGEMILMALTSASALAGHRHARENGLPVSEISARATMNTVQEGLPDDLRGSVRLPHLTYVDRFWRLLEFSGRLSEAQRDDLIRAMSRSRVERAIREGLQIDEKVVFHDPGTASAVFCGGTGGEDHVLKDREAMPAGERRNISSEPDWQVSATAIGSGASVVQAAGSLSVICDEDTGRANATPEEMLLAGLASCTTIYLARNAGFHDIPVDAVRVIVRADVPADAERPFGRIEKIAHVTGRLSSDQARALEGFAAHCAFGLTLCRGAEITDSVLVHETDHHAAGGSPLSVLNREAPVPDDPAYCTDGSCCVPAIVRQAGSQRPGKQRPHHHTQSGQTQ